MGEDGTLRENDALRTAYVSDHIRARRPDLSLVPLVNNWNGHEWEGAKLGRMLADPAARKRTIEQILVLVEAHRYAGISIDFENIAAKAQADFQRFMAELYAVMHPRKLLVSVNVPAADAAFDYRRLVRNADYLILMAYDEHWADGSPGPIASLPWFARVLRARQRDIAAEKMIVAIGNYAYDWGPRPAGRGAHFRRGRSHCQGIGRQAAARPRLAQPDLLLRRR
ncbi:MAG: glycosyl hydrolase family 18 protein [Candidatus Accumulibacter meliphilus]|uniref:glycosyl hydrolase family 18 protein n=1 Tax=Candidatus Accumulibacter meliphilus TaxID=2211374 RepID=UPI002FC3731E